MCRHAHDEEASQTDARPQSYGQHGRPVRLRFVGIASDGATFSCDILSSQGLALRLGNAHGPLVIPWMGR